MKIKIVLFLLMHVSISALSPRLLISVSLSSEFSHEELSNALEAQILKGDDDTSLCQQIDSLDLTTENHRIIIMGTIKNLAKIAREVGYDFIELHTTSLSDALAEIKEKEATIPLTDDSLPRMNAIIAGQLYALMMHVDTILKKHCITYWATFGTLLGAVRHQGLIPWDDDLDIALFAHDIPKLLALKPELRAIRLDIALHPMGWYKIYPINGKKIKVDEQYKNMYHQEYFDWTYPSVDIFPMQLTKDGVIHHSYQARKNWPTSYFLPQELLQQLHELPFGPMKIPIPHYYFTIIERIYGSDWNKIAYVKYDHQTELSIKKIKVQLTDRSQTAYVLPIN